MTAATDAQRSRDRRSLGIDFGSKRIGVAICDDAGLVATPHETIKRVGDEVVEHGRILELLRQVAATQIVIGLPLDLDGDRGPAARAVEAETRRLRKKIAAGGGDVLVHLQDERLTTVSADRSLREQGVRRDRRQGMIDQLAAATILQTWLDKDRPMPRGTP